MNVRENLLLFVINCREGDVGQETVFLSCVVWMSTSELWIAFSNKAESIINMSVCMEKAIVKILWSSANQYDWFILIVESGTVYRNVVWR